MLFDVIVIACIAILSVIGYFKGIINQFFSFAGILAGYLLSPQWTYIIEGLVRDLLPFSYVVCDMFSRLFVGVVIFLLVKLLGKFFEFMFAAKFREFATFNNWGGFFFGFLKSVMVIFVVMAFVTLIPSKIITKRFPELYGSGAFKISKRFNPIINPDVMENLRKLSDLTRSPRRIANISKSVVYNDYLQTKNLENPLRDEKAVRSFRKGDVNTMKKEGFFKLLFDKDFMDFIHGEKYYKVEGQALPPEKDQLKRETSRP